jgi:IS4 transposase
MPKTAWRLYAGKSLAPIRRKILGSYVPEDDKAGAFYVMDRGYLDFSRLYTMHQAGAFFVTRAKSPMDARRVYSATTDRATGVLCDQRVMLNGYYSAKKYPEHLRRIRFKDPETGKTLVFLTNNTALPALTICALYKSRWQVELFFKWIKQHLRIKHFLGNSENAVKTQVWCAVATYVLIAIVKRQLQLDTSLYTLLQILSVNIFENMPLQQALTENAQPSDNLVNPNQLNLLGV